MILFLACAEPPVVPDAFPDPGDYALSGPGGPAVALDAALVDTPCAALTGGPEDIEHHNLVGMYDGFLLMPWAPESGGGGITFFEFSDPCNPVKRGEAYEPLMRETHTLAIGRAGDRTVLAVDTLVDGDHGGVGFWDISDPDAPTWLSSLEIPNFAYPDAYFRVSLSASWQGDRLYLSSGLLGVFVIDVSDPSAPEILDNWTEVAFMSGSFHVIGNLALASTAGMSRTMLWDIGDPEDWQLLADFDVEDDLGEAHPYYFANVGGHYAFFARKDEGGGPVVYDIADPSAPLRVGAGFVADGDGGYVVRQNDLLFEGESNFGSRYDFSDPSAPTEIARIDMSGDFDTLVPIGNVAVASVDEGGDPGMATLVFPYDAEPDSLAPALELVNPADGATWVPVSGRIGLSFDEQIEPVSAHAGSLRVWKQDGSAVPGRFYGQETIVNFVPDEPLDPDTTYFVEVPAGGIADVSGNAVAVAATFSFSTGADLSERPW